MTQEQALASLKRDYTVKEIIKSKKCRFSAISKKLGVSELTVGDWYSGKSEPTKEQFDKLYKIKEPTSRGYKKNEESMCCAFRQQYVPMAVLDGTITDPDVLFYYGV